MFARPSPRSLASTFATLLATTAVLGCQAADGPEAAPEAPVATAGGQAMLDDLLEQEATARGKIEGLAEAIPEDAYGWRPGEGVRSVAEMFTHVAADNYLLPAILGVEAPEDTGITTDYATVQAFEARTMTKAEIQAALAESFDHLEAGIQATRSDLGRTANAFGQEFTTGGLWTMAITHLHEHLGQGIAYARMNGVVPPWSR